MTTTQTIINPVNVITANCHDALTALASYLRADLEVLKNDETGDEIASFVRWGETDNTDDDFEVHIMLDPYCPHGTGWVAVSDGEAIVTGSSVTDTVSRYRDWLHTED